ncbi:molybdopterin-binding protein [Phenylobacterium sp.]|jgi:DMSO/TMAO reductase YedYZ molybdopterin-dependent catalytic subunit|uniref:molybdopterin-binding protein n=1 Tax=Phenylobacterium sp. TaxID=1871053 RepID=UPI002E33BAB9|nr:molybdopterin-binding protein [Phenylobacterium sp.]HEX3366124.1 molybdopterin-binding protein [Phenylobacterium sp.]
MSLSANRRGWLRAGLASAGALVLGACDKITNSPKGIAVLQSAEGLTRRAQRLLINRKALAREFAPADISPDFRPNGSIDPQDADYLALKAKAFADYRLVIDGLVDKPLSLSLADLRALPSRTQITRHDCVEGWSSIAKWTGTRLGPLLDQAGLKKNARYIVFHCGDTLEETLDGTGVYYESIDLIDAYHPQTILAYAMNDRPLPVAHGAPLRLRVERQLGYKQAKYIMRLEAVEDYRHLGRGGGGFWEDRGYEWYAGI